MPKTWTDQPDIVADATVHLTFSHAHRAEVYELRATADGRVWYVTVGNLFGSQTVACPSAPRAMAVATSVMQATPRSFKLPDDCSLVANATEVSS